MDISASILNARILVVDDAEANVRLLEYMLAGAGYTSVTSTMDSREVFDLYQSNRYDIILLDLNMPYMNGFQVMERLKSIETEGYLPVLVITAEPAHKLQALQAGAKDFISKPIDQTEVLTRLYNMLEIRLLYKNLHRHNHSLEQQVQEQTSELRAAEEKVGFLSHFDSFTGLPNRVLLRERVQHAQEQAMRAQCVMGLLVVDLAKLPLIRGSLGVEAEQNLLVEAAARLKKWAGTDETVARFGDESFAIVTVKREPKELEEVAAQVIALLDEPFIFAEQELHVEACAGIAVCPNDGDGFDFLVQAAQTSARKALTGGARRCCFYTPELNHSANEQLKLENALRRAVERNEFLLHYQPQLDLARGVIVGLEALVRWQHPEHGLMPPAGFIGMAEDCGLILPLGEWVLLNACLQNKAWQDAGLPKVPVAVNLSAKQFAPGLIELVQRTLDATRLEPRYLELELTESLSMEDPESTIEILQRLKKMGVRLSIDDFGTGYSNLNYLKRFPVDKLKLDKSFVRDIISDSDDLSIARAVIAMAHSLRLTVIAEGVETPGQLAVLAQNGCDEIQGYLYSRPLDADACTAMLREREPPAPEKNADPAYARILLIVEDEEGNGAAIRQKFHGKGYRILVAGTAYEAFEILATETVGVILCEQRMTDMRGTEFLARVKHMYPAVMRIVSSGYLDLQTVADTVNQGAVFKFLAKPWDEDELAAALDEAFVEFESRLPEQMRESAVLPPAVAAADLTGEGA